MKTFLSLLLVAACFMACGTNASSGTGDDAQNAGTDGTDSADGTGETDGTDGSDGTDGTTGEIPDCPFMPPVGATCNPYPSCPASGCATGDICTVVVEGTIRRITCHEAGDVEDGGACDHESGPFCASGACVEGACRSFCVDNNECPANAACQPMTGVPGKPTVCGAPKADCDPLDPTATCPNGLACYLLSTGLTDCLTTSAAGQQDSPCAEPNECAAGFTCTTHEGNQLCARVCAADEANPATCGAVCGDGYAVKLLGGELSACVPGDDNPPPPPPPSCDALEQDCEAPAQACYPTNQGEVCLQEGTKPAGAQCGSVNECDEGLMCVANKCRTICDPEDPLNSMCEGGVDAQCAAPAGAHTGYCDE